MASDNRYSARLPDDMADDLDEYINENNISQSEAIRRSVDRLTDRKPLYDRLFNTALGLIAVTGLIEFQFGLPTLVYIPLMLAGLATLIGVTIRPLH